MNAKRNFKPLNTHQLKGVQKFYGYVRVVGAMLRLKLLHIIESRMLFSLLPRTIFLHSVNIHLI